MIDVIKLPDQKLITMYNGWLLEQYGNAIKDIKENGYRYVKEQYHGNENMTIWIKAV